jgi:hypothetical protein
MERTLPESHSWKILKVNPLVPNAGGILSIAPQTPSITLRVAADAIDDYVQAIELFTDEQWTAFCLGLSAAWLPFGLVCRQLIAEQIKRVQEELADYRVREATLTPEQLRNAQKDDPLSSRLPFGTAEQRLPSQILGDYLDLLREEELALSGIQRARTQRG